MHSGPGQYQGSGPGIVPPAVTEPANFPVFDPDDFVNIQKPGAETASRCVLTFAVKFGLTIAEQAISYLYKFHDVNYVYLFVYFNHFK
jgi:hypothetical protein